MMNTFQRQTIDALKQAGLVGSLVEEPFLKNFPAAMIADIPARIKADMEATTVFRGRGVTIYVRPSEARLSVFFDDDSPKTTADVLRDVQARS